MPMAWLLAACGLAALSVPFPALADGAAAAAPEQSALEAIYGPYAFIVRQIAELLFKLALVIVIVLPFQALWPAIRRRPKVMSYEYWLDIIYNVQGVWLSFLSFYAALAWLTDAIYADSAFWIPAIRTLPFWLQVALAVLAFDFMTYWRHRLEHSLPLLWSFHAVHHTTEKVDVLTTSRLHPLEMAFGALINAAVIRAGFEPAASGLGFAIYLHYNYFVHTNVRIRFPGFLKYVLVSPFMHHWHHAVNAEAAGKNVGVVFAWNDWLFGTAYHPEHWPERFGLGVPAAEGVGQSYLAQMLYPLTFALVRFRAWRAGRV
ncbi:MAG: sterol desaturase family protein, partial [Gammaproteobacteria bacterium]